MSPNPRTSTTVPDTQVFILICCVCLGFGSYVAVRHSQAPTFCCCLFKGLWSWTFAVCKAKPRCHPNKLYVFSLSRSALMNFNFNMLTEANWNVALMHRLSMSYTHLGDLLLTTPQNVLTAADHQWITFLLIRIPLWFFGVHLLRVYLVGLWAAYYIWITWSYASTQYILHSQIHSLSGTIIF